MPATYDLIIFDKDGTLIDFHAMWAGWARELAARLEYHTGAQVALPLMHAIGADPQTLRVDPAGPLAIETMANLHALLGTTLRACGVQPALADQAVDAAWHIPDPVALARPLADLPALFAHLRTNGTRIAVATTDDREPTVATLAGLGVASMVDMLACGDDGRPVKPAPDMILAICVQLGVQPSRAVMVGDTMADMRMGRAAGAGLIVGVLSGVSSVEILSPYADHVIPSVALLEPLVIK